jgi:ferritin
VIDAKMQDALNGQINAELYSANLYLSMSAFYEAQDLRGFANWMRVQFQEELSHATKIYDYVNDRDGRVTLQAVKGPPSDWDSPQAPFEAAYQHEQKVSGMFDKLADLAIQLRDHATHNFLEWFVAEQVEEEAAVKEIIQKLKLVGDSGEGLFLIDRELAQRVFTPPAA